MKLLNQTRHFASRAVNLEKLSHIFCDDLAPPDDGAPGVAGLAGASLRRWHISWRLCDSPNDVFVSFFNFAI